MGAHCIPALMLALLTGWEDAARQLATAHDLVALEQAANVLASSDDPKALARLGEFLRNPGFLARFDDHASPPLQHVLAALAQHPSPTTERLCLALATDPAFLAVDDRRIYLLPALAAVRPMSQAAADIIRQANSQGYYNLNIQLLANNGSVRALVLFEEMIRDRSVPVEQRVDALHAAMLPHRTNPAMLDCAARLLYVRLDKAVNVAVIESIFDDGYARWFPPDASPHAPPAWKDAPKAALERVLAMAAKVRNHGLSPEQDAAVDRTVDGVTRALAGGR